MKKFMAVFALISGCCALLAHDLNTWLPINGNLHREKAKYITVAGKSIEFRGTPSFSTKPIPAKNGQIFTLTAKVSGNGGKARLGFLTYANMGYKHCAGDGGLIFETTPEPKKRTLRIKINSKDVVSLRPTMTPLGNTVVKLEDVKITVEDPKVLPAGTYAVRASKWVVNTDPYAKTPQKYLTKEDETATFTTANKGIFYSNTEPFPAKDGNIVTVKMTVSGKGKAWIQVAGYENMGYKHCRGSARDTSFIIPEKPITRKFTFEMKGKKLAAVRSIFIVADHSKLVLENMEITIMDKKKHPPLNPLAPEASFFPGPISIARWIWSPCDIRFSYNRKVKMQDAFFRAKVNVEKPVKYAQVMAGFRLPGKLFVNGKEIVPTPFEQAPHALRGVKFVLTDALKQGENLLSVEIINKTEDKSCGLIYLGTIEYTDGTKKHFSSTKNVKAVKDLPAGNWKELAYDDSAWTNAMEMGDASTGRWMKMGNTIELFTTEEERKNYYDTLEAAKILPKEIAKKIAAEPETDAGIVWRGGLPMIKINSQREIVPIRRIGLSFTAPYDGYDFVWKSRNFGIDLYDLGMSDYHSAKSYWKAEGVYDFSSLDLPAVKLLKTNPNAVFIISIGTNVMRKWCMDHPDETIGYGMGPVNFKAREWDELGGRPLRPSPASRLFRKEVDRIFKALGEYVKSKPWGKRVIGIKYNYGVTAEWEYYGSTKQMPDTGVAMTKAFREYLRKKYGTDAALQKAWGKANASIDKAMPATPEERWGDRHFLRDPKKFRSVVDFYDCMHNEMADFMIFAGQTSKKYFPGRMFGTYYSYQNMPRSPEGAKTMEEKILKSGVLDFFMAPNDYNNETRSVGGTGMTRVRMSILKRFGKLGILEADVRTHIAETCEPVLRLKSPEASVSVIRRDFCNTIFDRSGLQLHQFGGNGPYRGGPDWYNSPEILEEIRKGMAVQHDVRKIKNMNWDQKIAIVSNYNEFGRHGYPKQDLLTNDYVVWWQIYALYCSGYTFNYMDMKDYMLSKDKYKVVVFLAPYTFDQKEREALRAKLRNTGTTAVWIYAPGIATENGFSDKAMEELTGIKLKSEFRKLPMAIDWGKNGTIGIYDPWHGNRIHRESPRIHSIDPSAKLVGKYSDGTAGFVEKDVDGFKSVFIGVPIRTAKHWAKIFADNGLKAIAKPHVIVRANSDLLMVHVAEGGVYNINLPKKCSRVLDMYENRKLVAENCSTLELICNKPSTWLFKMEQ